MTTSGTPGTLRFKGICALLGFLLSTLVASAKPEHFDIPAQTASSALKLFNKQSSKPAVFITDDLDQVQASEVKGEFEPAAALGQLLAHTGFGVTKTTSVNFVIGRVVVSETGSVKGSLVGEGGRGLPDVLVSVKETSQSASTDKYGGYYFPALKPGTYTLVATTTGYQPMHITDVQVRAGSDLVLGREEMRKRLGDVTPLEPFVVHADPIEQLEKIEVTDSKPQPFSDRNVDLPRTINDVQPYYIFDSKKIEESGTTDVESFLRQHLTMNTTVQTNAQKTVYQIGTGGSSFPSATSSIELNGLGVDHTLILVNGMRMPGVSVATGLVGQATGQPDVNGIPLNAIDRIEVLPSSAGAIYGANAVGGVINIVLKKAYTGGDISVTYGSTWDGHGPSQSVDATFGKAFEGGKTQFFVTAQYSDSRPILFGNRLALYNRGFGQLLQNDPAFIGYNPDPSQFAPPMGSTPNVLGYDPNTFTPVNLTLKSTGASLGSPIATFPTGYSPTSNPSSIIAGKWNTDPSLSNTSPNGLFMPLGNYPRRKSVMGTITRQMSDRLSLHADFSRAEDNSYSNYNPLYEFAVIPASVPVNPFNQDVTVVFPTNYSAPAISKVMSESITIGGTIKLPREWVAKVDYQWAQTSFYSSYANTPSSDPINAFTGPTFYASDPSYTYLGVPDNHATPLWSGAINPFVDTLAYPIDFSPYAGSVIHTGRNTSNDLVIAGSGPLYHLPWGDPRLSIRLEHDKTSTPSGGVYSVLPPANPFPGLPGAQASISTALAQSQSVDSANAELDLPIFKTQWPFLRSLDAQVNFSHVTSTVHSGTPTLNTYLPYPYGFYPNGAQFIGTPNSVSRNQPQPIASYTSQNGTIVPASAAQSISSKSVTSNDVFTGPAVSYRPFSDLLLRGSVASGYVPPTYIQLLPNTAVVPSISNSLIDPRTGLRVPGVNVYTLGGNADLKPSSSRSYDLGAIWEPTVSPLKGLRVDVEFTQTKQDNQIYNPSAQEIVNLESSFPGLVIRDSNGKITSVSTHYINFAEALQEAWTYSVDYSWRTSIGAFSLSGQETIQEHNKRQVAVNTIPLEYIGFPSSGGLAKTKTVGSLRWSWRNWVAQWTVTNVDGYNQHGAPNDPGSYAAQLETNKPYTLNTTYLVAQGSYTIPSQTYHNLYLSYSVPKAVFGGSSRWERWSNSLLDGVKVSLVVNNVFNTMPPFDAYYQPFYTSPFGDVQLRNFSVTLRKSF